MHKQQLTNFYFFKNHGHLQTANVNDPLRITSLLQKSVLYPSKPVDYSKSVLNLCRAVNEVLHVTCVSLRAIFTTMKSKQRTNGPVNAHLTFGPDFSTIRNFNQL